MLFAVVQSEAGSSAGGLLQSLGGLGALAGLPVGAANDRRARYIAYLKSREFTSRFIEANQMGQFLYPKLWDPASKAWRSDLEHTPTAQELFERFDRNIRELREDKLTGLVSLTVDWTDRALAADWANALINQANSELREKALMEARQSIEFLQGELSQTPILETRQSIYQLLEAQINAVMLANVRRDYAFQVLDAAVPTDSDKYIRPRPALVVALGSLGGVSIAALLLICIELRNAALARRGSASPHERPSA
ncbi:MAG: hypothetical protein ACREV5_17585 [Steroidobacter sp.]